MIARLIKKQYQQKNPQVYTQIESLEQNIDLLNGKLSALQDRLIPILSTKNTDTINAEKEQELVPLADNIRVCNNRLSSMIMRVDAITCSIEL